MTTTALKPADPAKRICLARRRLLRRVRGLCFTLALLCVTSQIPAQLLQGEWVQRTDDAIQKHRTTELRIIVLGPGGAPASGAKVHVQQLRHDFDVGLVVGDAGLPAERTGLPPYRVFNAIALDRLTAWPRLQPAPEDGAPAPLLALIEDARARGLTVRWGGVVSADAGRWPDWAAGLRGDALRESLLAHAERVARAGGGNVATFDLYTHALEHDQVEARLGTAMLRRLFEEFGAAAPSASRAVRFEDALSPERVQDMIDEATSLERSFVPFEAIAIEQRVGGILVQAPLARVFEVLGGLGKDVVIASLEIGGGSPSAAALNLETFLRTAFAQPRVTGIYFAGLAADSLTDPNAALLDDEGQPTAAGGIVDTLFRGAWWTSADAETDELGNVYTRAFFGEHRITATLADGSTLETRLYLHPQEPQRVVVLEPMAPPVIPTAE